MAEEDVLRKFYDGVSKSGSLTALEIPPSLVFFVRRALEDATGVCYTLEHVYCSVFLEGYLNPYKHFTKGLPKWYIEKYYGGKHPDMDTLRERLNIKYRRHLEAISVSAELTVDDVDIGEAK